jgi:hypothetical protein
MAYAMVGRVDVALARADESLSLLAPSGLEYCETQIVRGDLLMAQPEPRVKEAIEAYEKSARQAEQGQVRMAQLKAATRLVKMRPADASARDALAAVYGSFTEGLNLPDLVAARTVLDAR